MKQTPWFYTQRPVRVGVYKRRFSIEITKGIGFSHWNGRRWGVLAETAEKAHDYKHVRSALQTIPWRGLLLAPQHHHSD